MCAVLKKIHWAIFIFLLSSLADQRITASDFLCRDALLKVAKAKSRDEHVSWFTANTDGSPKPAGLFLFRSPQFHWKKISSRDEGQGYLNLLSAKLLFPIMRKFSTGESNAEGDPRAFVGHVIGGTSLTSEEVFNFFGVVTHYDSTHRRFQVLTSTGYPLLINNDGGLIIHVIDQPRIVGEVFNKIKNYSKWRLLNLRRKKIQPQGTQDIPDWIRQTPSRVEKIEFSSEHAGTSLQTEGQIKAEVPGVGPVFYWKTNRTKKDREEIIPAPYFEDLKGKSVLDAGCGGGGLVEDLRRDYPGQRIMGIDLHLNDEQRKKDYFVQGDLTESPFKDQEFDVVFSIWSIFSYNGLELQYKALKEIDRISKPGGVVRLGAVTHQHILNILQFLPGYEVTAVGSGMIELTKTPQSHHRKNK